MILIRKRLLHRWSLRLCSLLGAAAVLWGSATLPPQPVFAPAEGAPVVWIVDAGHGGEDGGAVSPDGVQESHINLDVALRLHALLRFAGQQAQLIRQADVGEIRSISDLAERDIAAQSDSLQETMARLGAVQAELNRLERLQAQSSGALSAVGDPDALEARRDQLLEEVAARTEELEALEMARAALARANESLRQRFSPALNRLAGELFDRLTGGKYHTLTLTRAFEAMAAAEGDLLPHNSLLLSQGTVDQLYLAVRLAVCQLTLAGEEPAPLVLDDALIHFDDGRMELALELLRELGQERQILLFTCHNRESRWAQEQGVPVLHLQSAGE